MPTDQPPDSPEPLRPYIRFSAAVAREACVRVAAGESQRSICADAHMPTTATLRRWAHERPAFARIFSRARAMGNRAGQGRGSSFCPATAHEIATRVAEGETLTAIARDPAMPSLGTIFYWRKSDAEFAEALRLAREALAERFADLGWEMALAATPQTAHLTRVRLNQLRWTAAILSPRTHGRVKPADPPEPPEVQTILFRHFELEVHPETGQHRVVGYCPQPDGTREREPSGPWIDPVDPIAKAAALDHAASRNRVRPQPALQPPDDDPEGWC